MFRETPSRSLLLAATLLTGCTTGPAPARSAARDEPPPQATPAIVDLRPQFDAFGLPPRRQGRRPTCSIFTVTNALEFATARASGHGERLSVEYLNWAANAATGRRDDGDFFHCALAGYARFGICRDDQLPYGDTFDPDAVPPPAALVDAGRHLGGIGTRLHVRWIRPNDGGRGLSPVQLDDVLATLARGWPVAVGAAHSRLLVGYHEDPAAAGGGTFATLDSGLGRFGEVSADYVRDATCDAFVVTADEPAPAARGAP